MAGMFDRAKGLAKDLSGRARNAVNENQDKIDGRIDKAAHYVDGKTKGKYADRIGKASGAAHKAVDRLGAPGGKGGKGSHSS